MVQEEQITAYWQNIKKEKKVPKEESAQGLQCRNCKHKMVFTLEEESGGFIVPTHLIKFSADDIRDLG